MNIIETLTPYAPYILAAYALVAILGAIFLPPDPAMPVANRIVFWALWFPILLWMLVKGGLDWWECEVAWRLRR